MANPPGRPRRLHSSANLREGRTQEATNQTQANEKIFLIMPKRTKKSASSSGKKKTRTPKKRSRGSRGSRVVGDFEGCPVGRLQTFIDDYVVTQNGSSLVISTWCAATYLMDIWDRFPHLAISSPEKRCGKTTLLELLFLIVNNPRFTTNISPAALYRIIEAERPTLLMDECQSLARRGSEASEVLREILNAGIGPNAKVIRCGGSNMNEIVEFSVYSPKVFALIGKPDAVLADRSIPVELRRKQAHDSVKRFRSRVVEKEAEPLKKSLRNWCEENQEKIQNIYDTIEPFEIENDRMADLLTPLQSILKVVNGPLEELEQFAYLLDERDRQEESQTPGVQLLVACKEIFKGYKFLSTDSLIKNLAKRDEEPWATWARGKPISPTAVAALLRPYGIRPDRKQKKEGRKVKTIRGYYSDDFKDAWGGYTP